MAQSLKYTHEKNGWKDTGSSSSGYNANESEDYSGLYKDQFNATTRGKDGKWYYIDPYTGKSSKPYSARSEAIEAYAKAFPASNAGYKGFTTGDIDTMSNKDATSAFSTERKHPDAAGIEYTGGPSTGESWMYGADYNKPFAKPKTRLEAQKRKMEVEAEAAKKGIDPEEVARNAELGAAKIKANNQNNENIHLRGLERHVDSNPKSPTYGKVTYTSPITGKTYSSVEEASKDFNLTKSIIEDDLSGAGVKTSYDHANGTVTFRTPFGTVIKGNIADLRPEIGGVANNQRDVNDKDSNAFAKVRHAMEKEVEGFVVKANKAGIETDVDTDPAGPFIKFRTSDGRTSKLYYGSDNFTKGIEKVLNHQKALDKKAGKQSNPSLMECMNYIVNDRTTAAADAGAKAASVITKSDPISIANESNSEAAKNEVEGDKVTRKAGVPAEAGEEEIDEEYIPNDDGGEVEAKDQLIDDSGDDINVGAKTDTTAALDSLENSVKEQDKLAENRANYRAFLANNPSTLKFIFDPKSGASKSDRAQAFLSLLGTAIVNGATGYVAGQKGEFGEWMQDPYSARFYKAALTSDANKQKGESGAEDTEALSNRLDALRKEERDLQALKNDVSNLTWTDFTRYAKAYKDAFIGVLTEEVSHASDKSATGEAGTGRWSPVDVKLAGSIDDKEANNLTADQLAARVLDGVLKDQKKFEQYKKLIQADYTDTIDRQIEDVQKQIEDTKALLNNVLSAQKAVEGVNTEEPAAADEKHAAETHAETHAEGGITGVYGEGEADPNGIVPGTSYTGDKVPARLNSGEMVLNEDQQKVVAEAIGTNEIGEPLFEKIDEAMKMQKRLGYDGHSSINKDFDYYLNRLRGGYTA